MCSCRLCIQRIPACDEERHPRDEAMGMPNQHILPRLITCKPFPTSGDLSLHVGVWVMNGKIDFARLAVCLDCCFGYSGDQKSQTRTVCQTVANANKLGIALGTAPEIICRVCVAHVHGMHASKSTTETTLQLLWIQCTDTDPYQRP